MNPRFLLSAFGLVFLLATYGVQTSEDVFEDTLRDLESRVEIIENHLELDNKVDTQKSDEKKEVKSGEGGTSASEEEGEDEGAAEYGDKADGDIAEDETTFRAGVVAIQFWPEGKVQYDIDETTLTRGCMVNITKALKEIEMKTAVGGAKCIQFIKKTSFMTSNFVHFTRKDGCWSKVGCKSGKQELSVGFGCCSVGTIMHEALHALGFFHEQARSDRDKNIDIVWSNIKPGWDSNFLKQPPGGTEVYKDVYDLKSIMHYGEHAYTKGDKYKTILIKKPSNVVLGQRKMLSEQDIKGLRKMYDCTAAGSGIAKDSCGASSSSYSGRTFPTRSSFRATSGSRPTYTGRTRPTYSKSGR